MSPCIESSSAMLELSGFPRGRKMETIGELGFRIIDFGGKGMPTLWDPTPKSQNTQFSEKNG